MKHIGEYELRIEAEALRALPDQLAGLTAADFDRLRFVGGKRGL
jgi:hypothetical protein